LAAGYDDGVIRLFDLRSGVCNRIFDGFHHAFGGLGHTDAITCLQFDEVNIITGSRYSLL
jgi:division protein 1